MDNRTWHDQRPTHRPIPIEVQEAKYIERITWDASDWILERAHEERDPDEKDIFYDAHQRMQFAAEVAGESLRQIQRRVF